MKIYSLEENNIIFYIGKAVNPFHRIYSHKKKFGSNIKLEVIDDVPDDEWKFWEKYYICLFKSWGFKLKNKNNGGGGPDKGRKIRSKDKEWKRKIGKANTGKLKSNSTKLKMRNAKLNKKGNFSNKKHSEKTKQLIKQLKSIPVFQYSLNGEFIRKWNSILEASQTLNIIKSSIALCSLNKINFNTAGGYLWSRNYVKNIKKPINGNSKKIAKTDKEGNIICIYNSLKETAIKEQISQGKIINSCKNKKNTYGKFRYKYL